MRRRLLIIVFGILFIINSFGQNNPVVLKEFIYEKAPFKSCHASTIAETETGLVGAWFGGTHEKHEDVEIWISKMQNNAWTDPVSVANGIVNNKRYPCWNPVLYYSNEQILYLFYKVGPSPSEWWGVMKKSEDDGVTWSTDIRLPEGILGPVKNKPVLIDDDVLLCPSSTENKKWEIQMECFHMKGMDWEDPILVNHGSDYNVIQPTILKLENGMLRMLCRSMEGLIISSLSRNEGKTWSAFEETSLPNPNSGIDAVTLNNGKHILVYNHTGTPKGKWGGNRHPLNVAVSVDGIKWQACIVLEDQEGEYSYPSVIQSRNGYIHIVYTWNRLKIKHVVIDPELLTEKDMSIWNQIN
jgi:alpha-L-rhamnosidase